MNYREQDVAHIYDVRAVIEGLAAELACSQRADLFLVEAALDGMIEAAEKGDMKGLIQNDLGFHIALLDAAGNPIVADVGRRLLFPLFAFMQMRVVARGQRTAAWRNDLQYHKNIVSIIREGNPVLAGQYVQHSLKHFSASASRFGPTYQTQPKMENQPGEDDLEISLPADSFPDERMKATVITSVETEDLRFPLKAGAGTDAVHTVNEYAFAVTRLLTGTHLQGTGIVLTLGKGNEIVCSLIAALAELLPKLPIEDLMADFGAVTRRLSDDANLRWLGPHKGAVHLALASITNACFDLWAEARGVPLWKLLLSLTPGEIVNLLDLSYLEEDLDRSAALQIIQNEWPTRAPEPKSYIGGIRDMTHLSVGFSTTMRSFARMQSMLSVMGFVL